MSSKKLLFSGSNNSTIITIDTTLGTGASFAIPTTGAGYLYDVDWGDGARTAGHTANASHTYSVGGVYQIEIFGDFPRFFFNNTGDKLKLKSVDKFKSNGWSDFQNNAFFGCSNLTSLSNDMQWTNLVVDGTYMFCLTSFSVLPVSATFNSLVRGDAMFASSKISTLPSSITFSEVTVGTYMFRECNLLLELPNSINFNSLLTGFEMFRFSNITTLSNSITFNKLENGQAMFKNTMITNLPPLIRFDKLSVGNNMFSGRTLNKARYSQLLIDLEAYNINNTVNFNGGSSKYNTAGQTARTALVARGWVITDGGFEA